MIETMTTADWLAERNQALCCEVELVGLDELRSWEFRPGTHDLVHSSGQFFSVHGLDVRTGERRWKQLIIRQDEIGLLGILAKRFDGQLQFLMQAKVEPGNINRVQLSPTVQATRSNLTRVHRGEPTRYLDLFTAPGRGRVLVDQLQSEQGRCFYRKRNRNMIVLTTDEVERHENYRWFTLDELHQLLPVDNLLNMDARSVLSCLPLTELYEGRALHSTQDLMSWLNDIRMTNDVRAQLVGLCELGSWQPNPAELADDSFRLVGVRVHAIGREVGSWEQPMITPLRPHVIAFLTTHLDNAPHVLMHADVEPGTLNVAELGPTLDRAPDADEDGLLSHVLESKPLFDTVLSEEGGRFYHGVNRYLVAYTTDPAEPGPDYRWVSVRQLESLVGQGHHVNVQARTLLACARANLKL
ncbi:NDP-hexose 2,3-dehydratase family protein [Amycolatopsis samaneae]|uniref:NDP-hexose 2,3-dehydratase family protein n=1 Tax=Amycolatopsis samaneae TaxID=664691 RepID=A0ABW5GPF5_9PSEU